MSSMTQENVFTQQVKESCRPGYSASGSLQTRKGRANAWRPSHGIFVEKFHRYCQICLICPICAGQPLVEAERIVSPGGFEYPLRGQLCGIRALRSELGRIILPSNPVSRLPMLWFMASNKAMKSIVSIRTIREG